MSHYVVTVTFEIDVENAENEREARREAITTISESSWDFLDVDYDIREV